MTMKVLVKKEKRAEIEFIYLFIQSLKFSVLFRQLVFGDLNNERGHLKANNKDKKYR